MATPLLLKYRRLVEDMLLFYKVHINLEISVTWEIAERQQNDKRCLPAYARIGISDHVANKSPDGAKVSWHKVRLVIYRLCDHEICEFPLVLKYLASGIQLLHGMPPNEPANKVLLPLPTF